MKEILRFVFLGTFALEGFAIAKEKIREQRKETVRVSVHNSDDPKPISHPTFTVYSGVPRSLNFHSSLTLSTGYSTRPRSASCTGGVSFTRISSRPTF
jgi:hypothetical protein